MIFGSLSHSPQHVQHALCKRNSTKNVTYDLHIDLNEQQFRDVWVGLPSIPVTKSKRDPFGCRGEKNASENHFRLRSDCLGSHRLLCNTKRSFPGPVPGMGTAMDR